LLGGIRNVSKTIETVHIYPLHLNVTEPLRRFVTLTPSIDVITYLLTFNLIHYNSV